ncbi:hypothetical protein NDU88_003357 [Pleurodeles waltl]|uniref:Uncharacterized protein n=1 Tax=Pleurodeles waltl TaxID=8319 RepID=A0AAV7PHX8_PLEWA|nr:hypothetical protein NDU88_003357 [Pleurodeles waltl]
MEFLGNSPSTIDLSLNEKINKLERLEKKLVRTRLHGHSLTKHLQSNTIPMGLQVMNEPDIFVDNPKFKEGFSFISNNCFRHWMVLGVETALEEVQKLMKEITELKKDIIENKALVNAKEALGPLDRSMEDFDTNTQMFKLNKLARDISLYDKKQTYPYLLEDYYKQDTRGKYSTRGRSGPRRYTTFSESSGTSGGESDTEQPSTSKALRDQDIQ